MARIIEDLSFVPYPKGIKAPNPDLNINARPGKFRYDRDFLLQFMDVCKERPDTFVPLDTIGLEPSKQGAIGYPGGARQGRRRVDTKGTSGPPSSQRQGPIEFEIGNVTPPAKRGFPTSSFQALPSQLEDNRSRFEASAPVIRDGPTILGSPTMASSFTPTEHGRRQKDIGGTNRGQKETSDQHEGLDGSELRTSKQGEQLTLYQVETLVLDEDDLESLLNKFTTADFDLVSDHILQRVNKSEPEEGNSTLIHLAELVFEKAKNGAAFSEMYARLCRKLVDQVSLNIREETIWDSGGKPIAGGLLFRERLEDLCQQSFRHELSNEANGAGNRRLSLGLVRFMGESFEQGLLAERIMHECIEKLLSNTSNPRERQVEGLYELLRTVGPSLDTAGSRSHMDVYFERMLDMTKISDIDPSIQFMLQDIIELRRRWQTELADVRLPISVIKAHRLVERNVKSLLNKLTADTFDPISDRIIEWANKSEQEKDGSILAQVIKLVLEQAKDRAAFSETYARLCRKMMERILPSVQDETIRNAQGQPVAGPRLLLKHLVNRCQEDFELRWPTKEASVAFAISEAGDDKAAKITGQADSLCSNESCAAVTARRQGLGLVRFLSELFKVQMLTERIMHECIKRLLSNTVDPKEEEIESLCELFRIIGQSLDTAKARIHMDIYFERMEEMSKGSHINSRMQLMLKDVINLRQRHWEADSAVAKPSTITDIDEYPKCNAANSSNTIHSAGGLYTTRYYDQQYIGRNVAGSVSDVQSPAKAGYLSQFGKTSKPSGLSFGLISLFNKKNSDSNDTSLSQARSSRNAFTELGAVGADGPSQPEAREKQSIEEID
ncbi:hypothetical protein FRC09_008886 [Ceratobasidium sp. 395]|nr:hypothetical protein FRC09_008886 [Ceratobasidium sp. 395]